MAARHTYFDQETSTELIDYSMEVEGLTSPDQVLNRLHDITSKKNPIRVLGANRFSIKASDWRRIGLSIPKPSAPRANRAALVANRTSSAISRNAVISWSGSVRDMAAARRSNALAIPPSSCASDDMTSLVNSTASTERSRCCSLFLPLAKTHLTAEVSNHSSNKGDSGMLPHQCQGNNNVARRHDDADFGDHAD